MSDKRNCRTGESIARPVFLFGASLLLVLPLLLSSCGENPESIRRRAEEQLRNKRYTDAEILFRKALAKNQSDGEAHGGLGRVYAAMQQPAKAYEHLRSGLTLAGPREDVLTALGELLLKSYWQDERRPQAVREELLSVSERLLKLNPRSFLAFRIQGYVAVIDRKPAEAAGYLAQAAALNPKDSDTTAMLMQALTNSGDPARAESTGRAFLEASPDDELVHEVLLQQYLGTRRAADAERLLTTRVSRNPLSIRARLRLARYYFETRQPQKAEEVIADTERNTGIPDRHASLGVLFESVGRPEEALKSYAKAVAEDPAQASACGKRQASILLSLDRVDEAEAIVGSLLGKEPNSLEMLRLRALILADHRNDVAGAVKTYEGLVANHPKDGSVQLEYGRLLLRQGEVEKADKALRVAVALVSDPRAALLALSSASMMRGDYSEALQRSEQLVELDPDNDAGRLGLVSALRALGRMAEARNMLNELTRRKGASPAVDLETGYLLLAEGRPEPAEALFRRLYRPGHQNVRVVAGLAEAVTAQGKLDEAVRLLRADLEAAPGRSIVQYGLAETLVRKGDLQAASGIYRSLLQTYPDRPFVFRRLAAIESALGRGAEAVKILTEAYSRTPGDVGLTLALAEARQSTGDVAGAIALYEKGLSKEPSNAPASNNLAWLLAERNQDLDRALSLGFAALKSDPANPVFQDTVGYVYLRKGMTGPAVTTFRNLVAKHSSKAVYLHHYGQALKASGDLRQAREQWTAALKLNPPPALRDEIQRALQTP